MANDFFGILFPNVHDDLLGEMTERRSMGALPFAGRYRIVDFALSNLVNAGISKVGIITKSHYQSLMDHIGNGKPWDLDRKLGGVLFLPPFSYNSSAIYRGHIDGLFGVMDFLKKRTEKYAVLCDCDVVTNFDMQKLLSSHIESGADVTVCYKTGKLPKNHNDIMVFSRDGDKIKEIRFPSAEEICDFSLNIMVISTDLLIKFVTEGYEAGISQIGEVFRKKLETYDFRCFEIKEFAAVIDSVDGFVSANRELIDNPTVRKQLFNPKHPVFTKTRDDMPTRYGLDSEVKNSLVADGCVIKGIVKNSVLFRGVKVEKGATIENCVIMQDSVINEMVDLKNVILDKNVSVSAAKNMCGAESYPIYIRKDTVV